MIFLLNDAPNTWGDPRLCRGIFFVRLVRARHSNCKRLLLDKGVAALNDGHALRLQLFGSDVNTSPNILTGEGSTCWTCSLPL
jgi:hypothetical protein